MREGERTAHNYNNNNNNIIIIIILPGPTGTEAVSPVSTHSVTTSSPML